METKQRVTREDLELKLTAFQDDLKSITSDKSEKIKALIVAGASIALLLAFWLGRRWPGICSRGCKSFRYC